MRGLLLLLSGLLFAGNLPALSTDTDKQQVSGQAVTQQNQSSASKDSSKRSGKPAATFNPSEKIGADSAVSFPVDI